MNIFKKLLGKCNRQEQYEQRKQSRASQCVGKRDTLMAQLERHGGTEGLDLSGIDLAFIDLSSEWVREQLKDKDFEDSPLWRARYTWGKGLYSFTLEGANLRGANLRGANLSGASLICTDLQGADLTDAQLVGANLWKADLSGAILIRTNLYGCAATEANLKGAYLYRAELGEATLIRANLQNAYLESAILSSSNLADAQIGKLLHEQPALLRDVLQPLASLYQFDVEWYIRRRYRSAANIYNEIKNSYLGSGLYEDASQAHFLERKMKRKARNPVRAPHSFEEQWPSTGRFVALRKAIFLTRFGLLYMLDIMSELVLGYGEKPSRVLVTACICILVFSLLYYAILPGSLSVYDPAASNYALSNQLWQKSHTKIL